MHKQCKLKDEFSKGTGLEKSGTNWVRYFSNNRLRSSIVFPRFNRNFTCYPTCSGANFRRN